MDTYPDELLPSELEKLKVEFLELARQYSEDWGDDDPDWYRQVADDLEFVAERLEVDVEEITEKLKGRARAAENRRAEQEGEAEGYEDEDRWEHSSGHSTDVDAMFNGLREELEDAG